MLAFINSDRAVVRKVLGGHPGAFRVLVERYGGVIHGVAFARLQNVADAEDVTQETFTRFYQQLDRMAHHKRIGAWLVHVARNACVDVARKQARETTLDDKNLAVRATVPDPGREELHRLLWEQLQGLDVESREVLVLHYFMKKRAREISALLDITPDAAFKRVQRAREELGRRLTDLLGAEIKEVMPDARRTDPRRTARIMAAVLATPVAWKASAAGALGAATAAGVATGTGGAKLAGAIALLAGMAVVAYVAYGRYARPYPPQDVRGQTSTTLEAKRNQVPDAPAVPQAEPAAPESAQQAETAGVGGEPVYPPVYGTVSGTLWMEDGTPASGAEVWVDNQLDVDVYESAIEMGLEQEPVELMKVSGKAGQDGRYVLEGLPLPPQSFGPQYALHARRGDYYGEGFLMGISHTKRLMEQDLTLVASHVFGGIVKGLDGKPVKGADVLLAEYEGNLTALSRNNWLHMGVLTKEDGRFLIEYFPVETCRVAVRARGYLEYVSPWLKAGSRDNVFQLDVGNWVSGRVVDGETGQPVGDVRINGYGIHNAENNFVWFDGEADGSGVFKITGCKPETYKLRIGPKGRNVLPLTLVEPLTVTVGAQPVTGLELKMRKGGVLRGNIIDEETGKAPTVRTVVLVQNDADRSDRQGKAGADGSYEVVGLSDGELTLSVYCGLASVSSERYSGKLSMKAGEVKENHEIRLPIRPVVAGTVVDEANKPMVGVSVCAVAVAGGKIAGSALSDTSGQFRLFAEEQGTASSSVYIQAIADDGYSAPSGPYRLNEAGSGLVLRVVRSGRLEGEVVDQAGLPVENAVVAAMPESTDALLALDPVEQEINRGKSINVRLKSGGGFEYGKLRPGKYTLEVYATASTPGAPVAVAAATVQAGRTTMARLVADMSGFGGVEGTALLDGKPLAGQHVVVKPVDAKWVRLVFAQTGPDGRYAIYGISPGQVEVTLEPEFRKGGSGVQKKQTVSIVSGEVTGVDFEFEGGQATAEGYVLMNGAPANYAAITFEPLDTPGSGGPTGTVNTEGWYKVEQIPEGTYRVEAAYGAAKQTVQAELARGETARIDFDLRICEINGVISGLKPEEKAYVALFPGGFQMPEWTFEALDALDEQMIDYTQVTVNGPFSFDEINEGEYVVVAVTLPKESKMSTEAILGGRVAVSPIVLAKPDAPAEVTLAFGTR